MPHLHMQKGRFFRVVDVMMVLMVMLGHLCQLARPLTPLSVGVTQDSMAAVVASMVELDTHVTIR